MMQYRRLGWWIKGDDQPQFSKDAITEALKQLNKPLYFIETSGDIGVAMGGSLIIGDQPSKSPARQEERYPCIALIPPLHPKDLGDPLFKQAYHLRYPYVVGAMANGITSTEMVQAAGQAGMLGFFGAAGLSIPQINTAIQQLQGCMGSAPFGLNLIHSPHDPKLEFETVRLYLEKGIHLISASAYMDLTLPLVFFRVKGICQNDNGTVTIPNKIFAKVSREEVARKFFSPPPQKLLKQLVDASMISEEESRAAAFIPMADVLTAEADSGGHTDNRPALPLLPTMIAIRDSMMDIHKFKMRLSVGLGGGIATPESAAAAFAMGADYILTGSINQACMEAGTSAAVRQMLAEAGQADVTMAPAADMFELGVKVQVLKRGTMFPLRAAKLYELYTRYDSYEDIPASQKSVIERDFFRKSYHEAWRDTRKFFEDRDPTQIQRAETDPKHRMALVFRSYLGQSSSWANMGEPSRKIDYQIWCGPAIGAFNSWVKGSFLELLEHRKTVVVALNILFGAAYIMRSNQIRQQGLTMSHIPTRLSPMDLTDMRRVIHDL